jgi:hypothetical protein
MTEKDKQKGTSQSEVLTQRHIASFLLHTLKYENGMWLAFDGDAVHSVAKLRVHSNSLATANRRKTTEEIPKDFVRISVW